MKKFLLLLAVAAFTCSPLFISEAQAAPGKHKLVKIIKHKAHHKGHHHAGKHHRKHHQA